MRRFLQLKTASRLPHGLPSRHDRNQTLEFAGLIPPSDPPPARHQWVPQCQLDMASVSANSASSWRTTTRLFVDGRVKSSGVVQHAHTVGIHERRACLAACAARSPSLARTFSALAALTRAIDRSACHTTMSSTFASVEGLDSSLHPITLMSACTTVIWGFRHLFSHNLFRHERLAGPAVGVRPPDP